MSHFATLTLAASLGLALASTAHAQNYAPTVNYQASLQQSAAIETGRSAFVAAVPYRGRAAVNTAPLGYQGAIPAGD